MNAGQTTNHDPDPPPSPAVLPPQGDFRVPAEPAVAPPQPLPPPALPQSSPGAPAADPFTEEVRALMVAESEKHGNVFKNFVILFVSIVIFAGLGLVQWSFYGVMLIIAAILVHECGHLIGMKLFGYRDVRMFFIPFFGAAISGTETSPSMTGRSVVALCGPIAGISAGTLAGLFYFATGIPILLEAAKIFMIINLINLLPLHPLDGSVLLDAAVFARHPRAELAFKIVTTILLGVLAILARDIALGIFAFFVFMTLPFTYIVASVSHTVSAELRANASAGDDGMRDPPLSRIVALLHGKLPGGKSRTPKLYAAYARLVTERVRNRPCTAGMAAALVSVYLLTTLFGFGAFVALAGLSGAGRGAVVKVESRTMPTGKDVRVRVVTIAGHRYSEAQVNDDGEMHGPGAEWYIGSTNLRTSGTWRNGNLHGAWTNWWTNGAVTDVTHYDMGKPVRYQLAVSGALVEVEYESWPDMLKQDPTTQSVESVTPR